MLLTSSAGPLTRSNTTHPGQLPPGADHPFGSCGGGVRPSIRSTRPTWRRTGQAASRPSPAGATTVPAPTCLAGRAICGPRCMRSTGPRGKPTALDSGLVLDALRRRGGRRLLRWWLTVGASRQRNGQVSSAEAGPDTAYDFWGHRSDVREIYEADHAGEGRHRLRLGQVRSTFTMKWSVTASACQAGDAPRLRTARRGAWPAGVEPPQRRGPRRPAP